MVPSVLLQRQPTVSFGLAALYLQWHYGMHLRAIVVSYIRYAAAFREMFSILFLLKTFVAPWKSIRDAYPQKGFNLQAILETLFLNLTARAIGAIIRLCAILVGLIIQIILITGFVLYLILWIAFPVILIGLPFYLIYAFFT